MARKRDPNSFVFQVLNVILAEGAIDEPKGLKAKIILRRLGRQPTPSGASQVSSAVRALRREYGLPILNGQSPHDGYWLSRMPSDMLSTINRFLEFGVGIRETREALQVVQERLALSEREFEQLMEAVRGQAESEEGE